MESSLMKVDTQEKYNILRKYRNEVRDAYEDATDYIKGRRLLYQIKHIDEVLERAEVDYPDFPKNYPEQ